MILIQYNLSDDDFNKFMSLHYAIIVVDELFEHKTISEAVFIRCFMYRIEKEWEIVHFITQMAKKYDAPDSDSVVVDVKRKIIQFMED